MQRHVSILGVISRRLTTLYSLPSNPKLYLQPYFIHCVKVSSTAAGNSIFRKMGDSHSQHSDSGLSETTHTDRPGKIKLTEEEWRKKLTADEFRVTRKHGTEPAWTGKLLENKAKGLYSCTCCGAELFSSAKKYDSGSGWPSFTDVLYDKDLDSVPAVDTVRDHSLGMVRTEVKCGKCEAHLGHLFTDGPESNGQRYCINSVCLKFKPEGADKQKSEH